MNHCDLVIDNCFVLLPDFQIIENASITIEKGRITAIASQEKISREYVASTQLNGCGKLAMPGFVDGHTHTAQQLLRGRTVDEPPMIWSRILVPYESHLTEQDVYVSALLACVEMIKAGITAFADAGGPFMHMAAEAVKKAGLRAAIASSNMDQGDFIPPQMKQPAVKVIRQNEELFKNYHGSADDRIRIFFGLRQVMTASQELVDLVAAAARQYKTGVHIHLAEHVNEVDYCLINYHMRPAEWLDSRRFLGPNVIAAHCVLLSDEEVVLLKEKGVKVVHCPRANFSNHGFAKTPLMCKLGIPIGLGNDGVSGHGVDHFTEMIVLKHAMQAHFGVPIRHPSVLTSQQVYTMATRGGAEALQISDDVGTLEVGKKADIILLNLDQPHLQPTNNLFQTVITAASARDVSDVVVDGNVLMKERRLITLDEEEIYNQSTEYMKTIAARAGLA